MYMSIPYWFSLLETLKVGLRFCPFVCKMFVCLFVASVAPKLFNGFRPNLVGMKGLGSSNAKLYLPHVFVHVQTGSIKEIEKKKLK